MDAEDRSRPLQQRRWRSRPLASWSIRVGVFLVPVALGFAAGLVIARSLPVPNGFGAAVLWWTCLLAGVLAVVLLATAGCRRFLPLAALLDLALLFPDRAPSRFAIARQTGSAKHLAAELSALRESTDGGAGSADRAARNERILALVAALSVHDARTRGHSERVRVYTDMLSEQLGLSDDDRDRLRWASMLHDIGKLAVPADVLNKREPLEAGEWSALHRHPLEGARILAPLAPWLGEWALAAEHHHEWWDGTGYPRGLRHEEISRAGRIVAVTDAFETMTASRPYRRALTPVAARRELVSSSGTQFDPRIVRAFLEISVGRLWRAVGIEALIAEVPLVGPMAWLSSRAAGWSGSAAATAGTVAVLAVAGVLAPADAPPFASSGISRAPAAAPITGPVAGSGPISPAAPAAALVSAPAAAVSAVLGATAAALVTTNATPGAGAVSGAPGSQPPAGGTSHGASDLTPGHGYGPAPGRGGVAPGKLFK